MTTPIWKMVRWPLPIALGLAMLATVTPEIGDDLDLQRVLQFLPYFVLGLVHEARALPHGAPPLGADRLAVPVFAAALAFGWWAVPRMNTAWFYHRDAAQELGAPWWAGPVMVLAMFGCSLVLTACFFAWVPRRHMWFTALGAGTLYGYLLHGFLVKAGDYQGWFERAWLHRPLGEIFVTVARGRRRHGAVHQAGAAHVPVRDGAEDGVGVQAGRGRAGPRNAQERPSRSSRACA